MSIRPALLRRRPHLCLFAITVAAATLVGAGAYEPRTLAEDGVGSVSGTVLDSAGKPAANVAVRLYGSAKLEGSNSRDDGNGGKGKGKGRSAGLDRLEHPLVGMVSGEIAAQARTDAQGRFAFNEVKAETYTYRIGDPGTVGYVAGKVTVEAGKTTTLDVKLKPPVK